jgi:hypothetical protein
MPKVKAVKGSEEGLNWFLEFDEAEVRQMAIDILKEERTRLRAAIPGIKHTVRQKQAIKKEKRIDYVIGRMVFFKEDFSTARQRMEQEVKNGEL